MDNERTQLAVIGAGPGGYPAAFLAADYGMDVTLIDPEPKPGGVCLFRGCIPTKTLLHVAQIIREAKEAKQWGVEFDAPRIDVDAVRSFKNRVVEKLTGGMGHLCKQRGIRSIRGMARFLDGKNLSIERQDEASMTLAFDHAILATGSRPAMLAGLPDGVLDSTSAMEMTSIPESLLVVGGGYIGLELGTFYASLGTRVSVVELLPDILPGADPDLVRTYSMSARKLFHEIITHTRVTSFEESNSGIDVVFESEEGDTREASYEKVLITVGRIPNSEHLGLENTKIELDEKGFVKVDAQRRTKEPAVFAIGDVVGGALLAHKATKEGKVAVDVISGKSVTFDPKAVPAVLFTDPEVTWSGLTELEAAAEERKVAVAKFPWGASGRAATLGRMDGVTKFIIDPETEKILGVGIVGPGAGELIAEGTLAVEMGACVRDIAKTIHPHPTLSETMMEAAEVFYGLSTHVYRPKRSP